MFERHRLRRSVVVTGTVAALALSGTIAGAVTMAGQRDQHDPAGVTPPTSAPPTTTTDPTIPPTTTTIIPPTTTTTITIPPTTTTTIPPGCFDPGPRPDQPGPPSDDPAIPPNGGSTLDDALKNVGGRIINLWKDNGYPGFAGVIAIPGAAVLDLYWLPGQPLPPEIAAIVASPGQPIQVVRTDAMFGRALLEGRAQSLFANVALNDQMCGFLHTIKVREEGTGLTAGVEPYDGSFNPAQAQQLLSSAAGVPVSVEVGPQGQYAARMNDAAPWFAGGGLSAGTTGCSAAFGIVDAGTRTREYLLTANHCFALNQNVNNGNGTAALGAVTITRPQFDSEVIRVTAAGQNTFFGGVNPIGVAEYNLPVRRSAANVRNTSACSSGASTGENCALNISFTNVTLQYRVRVGRRVVIVNGETNMVFADSTVRRRNGQLAVAVGQGDSGGPVVTDSSRDRMALGTMSQGRNVVGCGIFAAGTKICYSTVVYADLDNLLRSYVAAMR